MARLIDADVFKTEYENLITWVSHRTEKARLREFVDDIQSQPTVDAIPIEWIMWEWRRNQPDDTQEDAWMRLGVLKMLRDWRKVNGIN